MDKTEDKILYEFYKEYLEWVEAGSNSHEYFVKYYGLCSNLSLFLRHNYYNKLESYNMYHRVSYKMPTQFVSHGMDPHLPFNSSWNEYINENNESICHLNEKTHCLGSCSCSRRVQVKYYRLRCNATVF